MRTVRFQPSRTRPARTRPARNDLLIVAGLSVALLAWFLWPFLAHGEHFPLGPDAPVYLWWTRLAGEEGLSAVGHRAGVPALSLVLQGTLGRSVVEATAALEVALGAAVGLAVAALLRGRTTRAGWILAGALAGTFGVHLATGYLANLANAAAFLAAAVALAEGTRRSPWIAAGALAAAGLAHPLFFFLGAAILLLAAALAWRADRAEALRIGGAVLGGGALLGAGLLALLAGPCPPEVDTSRDAFLRRAGLGGELRSAYLDRLVQRWTRYVQWASLPLAALGLSSARGFVGRLLRAWVVALLVGVVVAVLTGWFPPDRFVTFGFAVPILAALGLVRLLGWFGDRRALGIAVSSILTLAMLAGAFIAWNRQEPFVSDEEVGAATAANALAAANDRGPLVFLVNERDETVTFLATRAGNVIRAAMPPDRIRDVVIVVPPLHDANRGPERSALERLTAQDQQRASLQAEGRPATFVLRPFDRVDGSSAGIVIEGASPESATGAVESLLPASPAAIAVTSVLVLAFTWLAGFGWARVAVADATSAVAAAPAFGVGALVLFAVSLERVGVPIEAAAGSWIVSAIAGGFGYAAWLVLERRARSRSAEEVPQHQDE
ncbi:MAG: hypothetical protein WD965_04100 [Actinomycetota bacterium]